MKRLMFIAILAVVSLSVTATVKKVKMYDRPFSTAGQVMHSEVPTTVTYQGDSIHVASDSLLTNATIVVRSVSGEILLRRENQTVGTTPLSYFVSNIVNTDFEIFMFSGNDFLYYGNSSNAFVDSNVAAYHVNQLSAYHGSQVHYYLELMVPTSLYEPLDYHWLVYVDQTLGSTNRHDFPCYRIPCNQSNLDNINIEYLGDVNTTIDSINSLNPVFLQSYQYGSNCNLKPSVSVSNIQNDAADNTYAIIVGGGTNKYNNYEEYWNDCSFLYQTLVNRYKIPKSNIKVLLGSGSSSQPSMLKADFQSIIPMPMDLDGDGTDDINGASCFDDFDSAILQLASNPNISKSHVCLFLMGEGGIDRDMSNQDNPYFCFYDFPALTDSLDYATLTTELSYIPSQSFNIFFGLTNMDSFVLSFKAAYEGNSTLSETPYVITGSTAEKCEDKPYHDFVYNWLCALNEKDIHEPAPLHPTPVIYDPQSHFSDSNGDGFVTMQEAYNYANSHSPSSSSLYSSPDSLSVDYAFQLLSPDEVDLYVRDYLGDRGLSHSWNTSLLRPVYWTSPDLYLRNTNDGFVNEEDEQLVVGSSPSTAYFYTRVHNRGITPYVGSGKYIHAYWFDPAAFGIGAVFSFIPVDDTMFGSIGIKEIGSGLEEGESSIEEMAWTVPDKIRQNLLSSYNHQLAYLVEINDSPTQHAQSWDDLHSLISSASMTNDIGYRKTYNATIASTLQNYTIGLSKGLGCENSRYSVISGHPDTEASIIGDDEDTLSVQISFDDSAVGVYACQVVQTDTLSGDVVDCFTICIHRTDEIVENSSTVSGGGIASLSQENGHMLVSLTEPALPNTQLKVDHVGTSVETGSYPVQVGLSSVSFPVGNQFDGFWVVTLLTDDRVLDTKKIYSSN